MRYMLKTVKLDEKMDKRREQRNYYEEMEWEYIKIRKNYKYSLKIVKLGKNKLNLLKKYEEELKKKKETFNISFINSWHFYHFYLSINFKSVDKQI